MPRVATGVANDPDFRKRRAAAGGAASHSVDRFIRALVKRAPELTPANKAALRALLASVDGGQQANG